MNEYGGGNYLIYKSSFLATRVVADYLEPAEQKFRPRIVQDPQKTHLKRWEVNGSIGPYVLATVEAPDGIGTTAGKSDRYVGSPSKARQLRDISARLAHMDQLGICLLYTSPSPRDQRGSRIPAWA